MSDACKTRVMDDNTIILLVDGVPGDNENIILDESVANQLFLSDDTTEIIVEVDENCVNTDGNSVYSVKRIHGEEKEVACVDLREAAQKDVECRHDVKDIHIDAASDSTLGQPKEQVMVAGKDEVSDMVINHNEKCKMGCQIVNPYPQVVCESSGSASIHNGRQEPQTSCNSEHEDTKDVNRSSAIELLSNGKEMDVICNWSLGSKGETKKYDPTLPFTCLHCPRVFKKELSLRIHELSHSSNGGKSEVTDEADRVYVCPVCKFQCASKKKIGAHMREVHCLFQYFNCDKCKFVALSPEDYANHMLSMWHSECVLSFKRKSETQARPFLCSQCGFSTVSFQRLERHMLVHTQIKDFACPHCSYRGKTEFYVKRHMVIHDKSKIHLCSLCAYSTHDVSALKRHMQHKHVVVDKYKCRECDAAFPDVSKLRVHAMLEHRCSDSYFCVHCSFACKDRLLLKEHTQIHKGRNVLSCDLCSYSCRSQSRLQAHKLRHTNCRRFKCSLCPRSFYEASGLKRHIKNHSSEKPFSCPFCDHRCKFRNTLTLHMKVHSDVKDYTCDHCEYSTKYAGNLRNHMMTHDEVKHFACQFCKYRARLKSALKRHLLRVHNSTDVNTL